jgi:hypothetical protein
MKTALNPIFVSLAFACICMVSRAEEKKEVINKELTFEKQDEQNLLLIRNISGSINIEGYEGTSVLIEVEKTISAENPEDVEEGNRDIQLGIIETGDSIILYMDSPYTEVIRKNGKVKFFTDFNDSEIHYDFNMDYTVRVPFGIKLNVSTVNNGNVRVADPRAEIQASNVNGSVYLENISGITRANTVNGVIRANYTRNPGGDCRYSTINGDIILTFLPELSADISYKTMNGDVYTNFINIEHLPPRVKTEQEHTEHGSSYRIEQQPSFRIGDGDIHLEFRTLNGDMIIKKSD